MPAERLINWLGLLVPLLLKEPATVPRNSPVELTLTVVVFGVVATEESAPATLAIKTPPVTLMEEPVNELLQPCPVSSCQRPAW